MGIEQVGNERDQMVNHFIAMFEQVGRQSAA
jgi:hypothetical protein